MPHSLFWQKLIFLCTRWARQRFWICDCHLKLFSCY